MKPNYFIIPLVTFIVSTLGNWITSGGLQWYRLSVIQPEWTPTGPTIGLIWTVIYICATIAALMAYNIAKPEQKAVIGGLFLANAALNVIWSVLFFGGQMIGLAVIETVILGSSVIVLIWKIWPISRIGAWLLAPYMIWVMIAAYLNYAIWILNK